MVSTAVKPQGHGSCAVLCCTYQPRGRWGTLGPFPADTQNVVCSGGRQVGAIRACRLAISRAAAGGGRMVCPNLVPSQGCRAGLRSDVLWDTGTGRGAAPCVCPCSRPRRAAQALGLPVLCRALAHAQLNVLQKGGAPRPGPRARRGRHAESTPRTLTRSGFAQNAAAAKTFS